MLAVLAMLATVAAACGDSTDAGLGRNGDIVTETRTVSDFDTLRVERGVEVSLTIDPAATDDVDLDVTGDSNLLRFLSTEVADSTLSVSIDGTTGGLRSTQGVEVSGTVAALDDISATTGAVARVSGSVPDLTAAAHNGAVIEGQDVRATTVDIDGDNGAVITVCATRSVTGTVTKGAELTVLCGGTTNGVETSNDGTISAELIPDG